MFTTAKPRSTPPISYPTAPSQSTLTPTSPLTAPSRVRRPSISNTMHWLSRSSTQSSATPYAPPKPAHVRSIELVSKPRSGILGTGAIVVRTPDEALRETGVHLTFEGNTNDNRSPSPLARSSISSEKALSVHVASLPVPCSPTSPPLPPLPMPEEDESDLLSEAEPEASKLPPRPTRSPHLAPAPLLRSSLKPKPVQHAEDHMHVRPLPVHTFTPPPFRPILVSDVPTSIVDPAKIIISLETSTATHKTTLETLTSRSCHLSKYLSVLLPSQRSSVASSVYSTASDDMSTYRRHLASQGLLPNQAPFSMHVFLDRPSAPYTHVLNYLRSPVGTPEVPETLPRNILTQAPHLRLECLLELQDEAAYLNLEGLRKLCAEEIRLQRNLRSHSRGYSSRGAATTHSHASVSSMQTLLEGSDIRTDPRHSTSSDAKSSKGSLNDVAIPRALPVSPSWNSSRGRSQSRISDQTPPAGWI